MAHIDTCTVYGIFAVRAISVTVPFKAVHTNSDVAWVIGVRGGLQFYRPQKFPLIIPIFATPLDCRPGQSAASAPLAIPLRTNSHAWHRHSLILSLLVLLKLWYFGHVA